jgi:hypothetical protein
MKTILTTTMTTGNTALAIPIVVVVSLMILVLPFLSPLEKTTSSSFTLIENNFLNILHSNPIALVSKTHIVDFFDGGDPIPPPPPDP